VKSGAKADRAALRQQLLGAGRTLDDVAAEMRRRWRFRPRECYRHAHGWSQDEVAARFTEVAARLAPGTRTPPMVGTRIGEYERWPIGGRRPSPYVLTVLAEVYGTDLARLLDDADTAAMPEPDRAVLAALASRPDRPLPRPGRHPVPQPVPQPVLRPVPQPLPAAAPDPPPGRPAEARFMARAAAEAADFGEWAEASSVGPITLEQLHQDVRTISRDYLTQPPYPLLLRALHHRRRVFRLLEGRLRPAHARELYLLAGRLCGLVAWMVSDLGYPAEAGTHARTAWLCADVADHPPLRGWVRATQSKLAYWDGRPRTSAQLAEDGLRHGVQDSGRVLLAGLAARGWARNGDADRARMALTVVTAERAKLATADEVGGVWSCSEAQQHYLAGTTQLWLRDPDAAAREADRAVWLYEIADPDERFYGAEALALLDSAIAHVLTGDLTEAAHRLAPVLELPPEKRVTLITGRAQDLRRVLDRLPGGHGPAAEIAGDLAHFERTAS
jgi:transcriptional regulator with XRE-family HTH domain